MGLRPTAGDILASALCLAVLSLSLPPQQLSGAGSPNEPLRLDIYTASERSFNVTSTLIYGKTESILIDMQYYKSHASELAERIAATGTHLKAIVVTHPHDDHYMAGMVIHERFPDTPIYMTSAALEEFNQTAPGALAGQKQYIPSETPDKLVAPTVLPTTNFLVDGEQVQIMRDAQGDVLKPTNTWVWVPSLRAVVAGDVVFNGVHVWLANSNEESRAAWLHSLEHISALNPRTVVAGHKGRTDLKDIPEAVTFTANYIREFDATKKGATDPSSLLATMKAKYPDLALADQILARSAKSAFTK